MDNLPAPLVASIRSHGALRVLESRTGAWEPFVMRTDRPPFDDVRVRQAFRLLVNRPQMLEDVPLGHGRVANDLYSPLDPDYDAALRQRAQD